MGNRITNQDLKYKFEHMIEIAKSAGVDTEGWSFGQHYGHLYQIVAKRGDSASGGKMISANWLTKREAYYGMGDMINGIFLVWNFDTVKA